MKTPTAHPSVTHLDYNATTPVDQQVITTTMPLLAVEFVNPYSTHAQGEAPWAVRPTALGINSTLITKNAGTVLVL